MKESLPPNPIAAGGTMKPSCDAPTRGRFVVLAWLCAAAALAYVSRNAIAVAESTVRRDLGLSREQSGWVMSAFFLSYALGQIPAAALGQRVGSRLALPMFAAIWSLATGAIALMSGLGGVMVARVVQGVAQAGLVPVATLTLSRWFPATGRAFATGALASFMSIGGALCAWWTGGLMEALEPRVAPGWNWRIVFLIFSLPGVVWAAGFWKWFREYPRDHPSVNEAERQEIQGGDGAAWIDAKADPPGAGSGSVPWRALCVSPALWWICGQQAFRAAGYIFFSSWFATYLQETRGVGIAKSGFLNMLPLLAVVAGSLAGGALSDLVLKRTGSRDFARRWLSVACLLACAALIFLARRLEGALEAVLVISAGSLLAGLASPCAYALTMDMGGRHVAAVNATMNMTGNLGALAFPILVPWLLSRFGSWDAVLAVFGGLHVAAAGCWLLLKTDGTILDPSWTRARPPSSGNS